MNNFSSASAIVTALMSPMVMNLILMCESKAKPVVHMLDRDLTSTNGAYYETLCQVETKELISWLGIVGSPYLSCLPLSPWILIDSHLSALKLAFACSNAVFEVD